MTVFGSHLFGTNTATSDRDFKRVVIPSTIDILLPEGHGTVHDSTGNPNAKNSFEDVDCETFTLRRALDHIMEGQPQAMDMLFSTPLVLDGQIAGSVSDDWRAVWYGRRNLFSRKPGSFLQYCKTQANKYGIKGSRLSAARKALNMLKDVEKAKAAQKLYELDPAVWAYLTEGEEFLNITEQDPAIQDRIKFLEVNSRKIPMTASVDYAIGILQRMVDGYGDRAKLAEKNEGIDWKALSHAVRIGQQAVEFLRTANIIFPRPNVEELLDIKLGRRSYKEVADMIESLLDQVSARSEMSLLPNEPNYAWARAFVYNTYAEKVLHYG